ncbi:MAG: hypothetical protein SPL65_08985, partial [Lachnospiraceae bacterium]|nr:hypothetical protein [Lachnospiraceae bacterium]
MEEKAGIVFSIARDNAPVPGCTVSKNIYDGLNSITYFSLARGTDISAETHPDRQIIIVADGVLDVYGTDVASVELKTGECVLVPIFTILLPTYLIHFYRKYQGWTLIELGRKERRMVPYVIS